MELHKLQMKWYNEDQHTIPGRETEHTKVTI